jgi:hypothetical protein
MSTATIPLARNEAAAIAQRAFLENITGQLGIWSYLKAQIRPDRLKSPRPKPKVANLRLVTSTAH